MTIDLSQSNKLVITCDLGGSLSRAIAQLYPDGVPSVIVMSPEVADVSQGSLKHIQIDKEATDSAWVGLGNEYYVLGTLAKNNFAGITPLKALKNKYAIPKIAALLWQACRQYELKNPEVMIHLLLPSGETKDKDVEDLSNQLTFLLKQGINTPTGLLKAKLRKFYVLPEGSGVLSYRLRSLSSLAYQKSIGILMLGYRNSSFFFWDKGSKGKSETTNLGMSWMVQQFVERTSVGLSKDDLRLVPALVNGGEGDFQGFRVLSRKPTIEGIEADLQLFSEVLPTVKDEYCRALQRWLDNIGAVFDEVVICGGTASFVRTELVNHFHKEGVSICWNGEVNIPEALDTYKLKERLADVWTSHISHIKLVDKKFRYDRQQPLVPQPVKPVKTVERCHPDRWKNFIPMLEP